MLNNAYDKKSQAQKPETFSGQNADNDTNTALVKTVTETPRFVAPTHGGVDILKLLTELEDLVENTKHGPLGMLFGFDEDKFHMTIMKIRANLPEEMKRASKLARDSERIVEESRDHAERMVEEARRAALMEFENGKADAVRLKQDAQAESVRLKQEAQAESARLKQETQAESARLAEAARREAERVQEQARKTGDEILAESRTRAAQLVADSEIVQRAQAEAQDMLLRAEAEAQAVRRGGDEYARDMLVNLEAVLGKAVTQVQRGREMLERG